MLIKLNKFKIKLWMEAKGIKELLKRSEQDLKCCKRSVRSLGSYLRNEVGNLEVSYESNISCPQQHSLGYNKLLVKP